MADSATDKVKEKVVDAATGDDDGLIAPLKKAAITAAVAALTPVVKNAAEGAANKLPEMLENAGGPEGIANLAKDKIGEAGGMGGIAKFAMDQVGGGGGGGGMLSSAMGALTGGAIGGGDDDSDGGGKPPDGAGSGRRMPVQQAVDVAAPIEVVYNQFTQFEEWTKFMHRVESASQEDEGHVNFKTKMWAVNRQWESEITDQRPDERIAWKTTSGPNLAGVATFHELAPRLTRVEVNVDFAPQGFFEKIGRGWRFAKRAIRGDLHRFKAYVEMHEEETGEWRGYIRDGEPIEEQDYYGEEKAAGAEGALVDEEGNPVSLDEEGNLVGEDGETVALDEEGNPVAFDEAGHPIAFDEEGNLVAVDEEGNPVAAAEEDVEEEPDAEEEPEEDLASRPIDEEELEEEEGEEEPEAEVEETEEELEAEPVAAGGRKSRSSRARDAGSGSSSSWRTRASGGGRSAASGRRSRAADGNGAPASGGGRSRSTGGGGRSASQGKAKTGSTRGRTKAAGGSRGSS